MRDKGQNPLAEIIKDGGYTAIFRTIGFIGDSLGSGEHESLDENGNIGFHDYYEYSWIQFIARKCGLKAYNFSVGGLTAKEFFSLARYMKVFTPEKACQAYIIALGVNDMKDIGGIGQRCGACQGVQRNRGFGVCAAQCSAQGDRRRICRCGRGRQLICAAITRKKL